MDRLDQNRKNKISTQPAPDTSANKECKPATPESLHIYNTETTHLIFVFIEKRDASTITKQVGSLFLQAR